MTAIAPMRATAPFDHLTFRRTLGHYPTGVCVVTGIDAAGLPVGLVIGSFTSVSLSPALVGFFPDRSSTSWPRIAPAGRFCVNILSADQADLCGRFAGKADDKFTGLSHQCSAAGLPVLDGVVGWIDCRLEAIHDAGDHLFVMGNVEELAVVRGDDPMLFFRGRYGRFRELG